VRTVNDADKYNPISESTDAVLKQGFAPIEQYQRRGSLGPWTDVYALCATICYCVTGAVIADAPMRAMETQVLDLSGATDITAGQIRALEQGLAVDLVRRTSSVEELRKALYVTDPGPDPGSGLLKRLRKLWVALRANWLRWMTRRGPGRGRKWVIAAAAVLVINLVMGIAGNIEGWVRRGDNYSYYRSFGSKLKDSWLEENGVFYHFDKQGNMDTRWCTIDGGRYYFGSDGIMRTGWQDIGGDRYYFDDNGEMCTGWRRIDGKMYYFADDGIMRTGNQVINGKTYVIGPDGVLEE